MSPKFKFYVLSSILFVCALTATIYFVKNDHSPTPAAKIKSIEGVTQALPKAAPSPKAKEVYKIGILFPTLDSPFWQAESFGIIDQAKKLGVEAIWYSAGGFDKIENQDAQMRDLIKQGVDAILLAPISYTGSIHIVEDANAAGVPIITHVTTSESSKTAASVVNDDSGIGRSQARALGKSIKGTGTIVMLNGPSGVEWSARRVDAFLAILKKEFPDITVVDSKFGELDQAQAKQVIFEWLSVHPELKAIYTVSEAMAMGAADAVKEAERSEKIEIVTAGFSRELAPYLIDGRITTAVDDNAASLGRLALDLTVRALNGEPISRKTVMPIRAINKENIEKIQMDTQWPPSDWKTQIAAQ